LRISEALALSRDAVDFDNLLICVRAGKGGKHRMVPMSFELRKRVWKYATRTQSPQQRFLFETRNHTRMTVRNIQRDFNRLCRRLRIEGVRTSPHTLRHTFAISYLRAGGNLFYLSKILGHTSVQTTERYLQSLQVEDLQAVHNRLSLLARG
jgi:site-specific recombinase XerD